LDFFDHARPAFLYFAEASVLDKSLSHMLPLRKDEQWSRRMRGLECDFGEARSIDW